MDGKATAILGVWKWKTNNKTQWLASTTLSYNCKYIFTPADEKWFGVSTALLSISNYMKYLAYFDLRRWKLKNAFHWKLPLPHPSPTLFHSHSPALRGSESLSRPFAPALRQLPLGCGTLFGIHTHLKWTRRGQFLSAPGPFSLPWESVGSAHLRRSAWQSSHLGGKEVAV